MKLSPNTWDGMSITTSKMLGDEHEIYHWRRFWDRIRAGGPGGCRHPGEKSPPQFIPIDTG